METKANHYRNLEELFELADSEHDALGSVRETLKTLKTAWDMNALVKSLFAKWSTFLWSEIDTDELVDRTRILQKQIKSLPRRMRSWDVYKNIQTEIKNMATILPVVSELRSDAMRDRHWKTIMHITHKHVEMGPGFALQDVLQLVS